MLLDRGADGTTVAARPAVEPVVLTCDVSWRDPSPVSAIQQSFGDTPLSFLALFVSPQADIAHVTAQAADLFPNIDVAACTTAGEIGAHGYDEGRIVAIGFPSAGFTSTSMMIEHTHDLQPEPLTDLVAQERVALENRTPQMPHGFAFLIVDGLAQSEDALAASISPALRNMPIFGGSAGDGIDFKQTLVALNGKVAEGAAVLTLVRSRYRAHVFSLDHMTPCDTKMVVTEADPARRIVKTINAEPAAREYARIVGLDPEQLNQFTFASRPVVVRFGGTHHVRAIREVTEAGELVFFSAIDEGMVLTVAAPQNMVEHLREKMAELSQNGAPAHILGCDCLLRRIEAEQKQMTRGLSEILSQHNVTGFSTYGEQIGPLHVNHTMSGVAIYGPEA